MAEKMTVSYQKKPCYDIVFERSFEGLAAQLQELQCEDRKLCIVTDSNVGPLYVPELIFLHFRQGRKIRTWIR